MTSLQMVDVLNATPALAARAAYELPEAPLAMPEQDLRSARLAARQGKSTGWLGLLMRNLRAPTPPQGTARS